jgi:hypothetical protein
MLQFAELIKGEHPGIFVHSIYVEENLDQDQRAGFVRVVSCRVDCPSLRACLLLLLLLLLPVLCVLGFGGGAFTDALDVRTGAPGAGWGRPRKERNVYVIAVPCVGALYAVNPHKITHPYSETDAKSVASVSCPSLFSILYSITFSIKFNHIKAIPISNFRNRIHSPD